MAAFTTTVQKIGINGLHLSTQGGMVGFSTATSSVTLTVADLKNVILVAHNPSGATDITITVSSTQTATRYAGSVLDSMVLTTSLGSSDYAFFGNLESAYFKSTSNTIVVTASTAILMGAIELSSTRQN